MSLIYINPYALASTGAAFFLDTYPGALAAYSLRSLSSSVTNVVKVRRSAGSPAEADFTAAQVANGELAAWVGAGNNGFVTTWYDQSGNGQNAVQATSGSQPQIVSSGSLITDGTNAKPSISYSGGAKSLSATLGSSPNGQSSMSLITVVSPTVAILGNATRAFMHMAETGSWGSIFHNVCTDSFRYRFGSSESGNNQTIVRAITSAISQTFKEGTAEYARINGTDYTRGTTALATTANTSTTLTFGLGDNASFPFVGKASEAFMYLSSQRTNASAIEANINAYYGIFV
jgi:hypothetical protein